MNFASTLPRRSMHGVFADVPAGLVAARMLDDYQRMLAECKGVEMRFLQPGVSAQQRAKAAKLLRSLSTRFGELAQGIEGTQP